MADTPLTLGSGYPAADDAAWTAMAEKLLKGKPVESLRTSLPDDIVIEPLYTTTDAPDPGWPGFAPYVRGAGAAGAVASGWDVRQRYALADPAAQNSAVLDGLERGVTSVWLQVDSADDLPRMLEGVLFDLATVALDAGHRQVAAARQLIELWTAADADGTKQALGSLRLDPLGLLARTGTLASPLDESLAEVAAISAEVAAGWTNVRTVAVDATPYTDAGAPPVRELAISLATGVAYLRALTDAGLSIDQACAQLEFTYSADADQFTTIAKLRAARRLWARVAQACDAPAEHQAQHQHAVSHGPMFTANDPWVNLLRGTVAAFAAGVGGADAVTVEPFDLALGQADELALRMARNTQLLLIEESNVARAIDPAGGSWYVETLTDQLANAAWAAFQQIEAAGGMAAYLTDGAARSAILSAVEQLDAVVATRRRPITGVSEFPDIDEAPLSRADRPARPTPDSAAVEIEPLAPYRPSAGFEQLRSAASGNDAAQVFMANLGPWAVHTARTSWATNFAAVGGLRAIDVGSFDTPEAAAAACAKAAGRAAIICSSDAVYAEQAGATAKALKDAGAEMVFLAGNPGDKKLAYVGDGIDGFVHVGCDVQRILTSIHRRLGLGEFA